ncbi:Uncharacterised protein [Budvicia aquatica]|uniref:Uncharacterized protein n=1 Tax=Budvicia aquatica TaxID=82979 RepID=A0A484ZRK7_9GAMM|nr:Uncharacterised protein [Budvicia aquatica]
MAMRKKAKKKRPKTFFETLTEAVNYYIDNGWDSEKALLSWSNKLRIASHRETADAATTRNHLTAIYKRLVIDGGALKDQPADGVNAFTLKKMKPDLRKELDRRIFAASELIKLNRTQAIDKTIQRFQGWVSSVPPGGTNAADRVEQKRGIMGALEDQGYIDRRVAIVQGHKTGFKRDFPHFNPRWRNSVQMAFVVASSRLWLPERPQRPR